MTGPLTHFASGGRVSAATPSMSDAAKALMDMFAGALRGSVVGATGAPGDLEAAYNKYTPDIMPKTGGILPTSDEVDAYLPPIEGHTAKIAGKLGQFAPIGGAVAGIGSKLARTAAPKVAVESFDDMMRSLNQYAAKITPKTATKAVQNNASGESDASVEAINRLNSENTAGRHIVVVKPDGTLVRLPTVDRVDYTPTKGEVVMQRGVGRDPSGWTVRDAGAGGNTDRAMALVRKNYVETPKPTEEITLPEIPGNEDLNHYAAGGRVLPAGITTEQLSTLERSRSLPPGLLLSMITAESNGNPNAVSPKGAEGILQFMPKTAAMMKIDAKDPRQAIVGAADYMNKLITQFGDIPTALAAWNWGPGNVQRKGTDKLPKETQQFVKKVLSGVLQKAPPPDQVPAPATRQVAVAQPTQPEQDTQDMGAIDEAHMSELLMALLDDEEE